MTHIDETIEAFRVNKFDLDCREIILSQNKKDGKKFDGPGYIRQLDNGSMIFKIYVLNHNTTSSNHIENISSRSIGKILPEEEFYDLEVVSHDGTNWKASKILPTFSWNFQSGTVIANGNISSIIAYLKPFEQKFYMELRFFEDFDLQFELMTEIKSHKGEYYIRNRTEFDAHGYKFVIRKQIETLETIIEVTSDTLFQKGLSLRIQEALQYVTARSAIYQVCLESGGNYRHLELVVSGRKSKKITLSPPISLASINFSDQVWLLFQRYLDYVIKNTRDTYWNSVAYHLYNARESTANSIDAEAAGISIAVEAITSLINLGSDPEAKKQVKQFQVAAKKMDR